ncbi:SusC/RagA family TonB-linked outer membrane protein [Chitinophaga lutea]|uniref:SusC/RagA family TonB-linked outer membrane protein n=2 Tax=Chitinophaga lutea TaxID=2488634 RepID=A0A3N4PQK3_9BACT|nr:SusC/RagA family TonB-linked outer membrane protein [Chitinophaga lutea]
MPGPCSQMLRVMRYTAYLMLLFFLHVSGKNMAQAVTISGNNMPLTKVFHLIEKQTGYVIFSNKKVLENSRPVSLNAVNMPLPQLLDLALTGQPLGYEINNKTILIYRKKEDGIPAQNPAAAGNVTGIVLDSANAPVERATVRLMPGNKGTSTNQRGAFLISGVAPGSYVLEISCLGYQSVRHPLTVTGSQELNLGNIRLRQSSNTLGQVEVVVAYGTVKKTDLTGSVGQVNMADLSKAPVASFTEALAGRIAGVQVSSQDGQPGKGMGIVIRGANSLTQSNSPLYVIDGFPIEDPEDGMLNPDDIESISILKDASATAIYGSRAANGVILVETKKGKIGKPVVTLNLSHGIQQAQKQMEVMGAYDFVKYQNELNKTSAAATYFQNGRTLESYKDVQGIDWQDQVFRQSPISIGNIAVRGGSGQTRYSISGSVYDQEGIVINSGYSRYQGRVSIDQSIGRQFKAGLTANYSRLTTFGQPLAEGNGPSFTTYLLSRAWGYRPVAGDPNTDLQDDDGDMAFLNQYDIRLNPITTNNNEYNKSRTSDFLANAYVTYSPLSNLVFRFAGSMSNRQRRGDVFYNSKTVQGSPLNPRNVRGVNGSVIFTETNIWSNDNTVTYTTNFSKDHKITALGGVSFQEYKAETYGYAAQNLPNEQLEMPGLDEGIPYSSFASGGENFMASYFGRLTYNYQSKYLLEFTFRGDGSSKFAKGHKWGYFPSGSFAWNMQEENFMRGLKVVSNSKLRFSYGSTGNNRVGNYDAFAGLSFPVANSYSFNNGVPGKGAIIGGLGNENLRWETTRQLNIGYDLGLFNNRIEVTADWYRKITSDLLLNADLPATMGMLNAQQNIGKIRNQGIELSLKTVNVKTKAFEWSSSFNIAFNQNKILELVRGQDALYSTVNFETQYNNNPPYISQVGQPAGMFYGYIFDGVYQLSDFDKSPAGKYTLKAGVHNNGAAAQPGHIKYRDVNGDGDITTADLVVIGRGQPIHTGGFSNNFSYKGFDLGIFLQWSYGNDILNANRYMFEGNGNIRLSLNQFASYLDRWSETNPTNRNFKPGGQGTIGSYSSRVLEDGSYLRLKTVSLGYNIPDRLLRTLHLTRLRLTVAAQNLLTLTSYSGMDPEVSVRSSVLTPGFDFSAYPIARTVVFGLNVTF